MRKDGGLRDIIKRRYASWDSEIGQKLEAGELSLEDMHAYTLEHGEPKLESGRQEMIENMINDYI